VIGVCNGVNLYKTSRSPKSKDRGYLKFDPQSQNLREFVNEKARKASVQKENEVHKIKLGLSSEENYIPSNLEDENDYHDLNETEVSFQTSFSYQDVELISINNSKGTDEKFAQVNMDDLSAEHKLVEMLFSGYNKHIRPVNRNHDPTHVVFEVSLFNIMDMVTQEIKL